MKYPARTLLVLLCFTPDLSLHAQTISGHLYRADLKTPIKGATVELWSETERQVKASTKSSRAGAYEIDLDAKNLPDAPFLRIIASGFQEKFERIDLEKTPVSRDLVLLTGTVIEPRPEFDYLRALTRKPLHTWNISLDEKPPVGWTAGPLTGDTLLLPVGDSYQISSGTPRGFQDLYARANVSIEDASRKLHYLYLATDDGAEAWINGQQVLDDLKAKRGFTRWNYVLDVTPQIKEGRNTIAVHVKNLGGESYFDALIIEKLCWQWRSDPPPTDWIRQYKSSESGWKIGTMPIKGEWQDVYARRILKIPSKPLSSYAIHVDAREIADIWINGQHVFGAKNVSWPLPIRIGDALQPGDNIIAIHVMNTKRNGLVDVEFTTGERVSEQWIQLKGKYVVLEAPPEYGLVLKHHQAWKVCDQSYTFFRKLFGNRPFGGKPVQLRFDCTVGRGKGIAGNPARFGVIYWRSPPAYWAMTHEMIHAFAGLPEFKVLKPERFFVEIWPPLIGSLNCRQLDMEDLAREKMAERITAFEKDMSSGKRGMELSQRAWKGFMLQLVNKRVPSVDKQAMVFRSLFSLVRKNQSKDSRLSKAERWNRLVYYLSRALREDLTREFLAVGAPIDAARVRRMLKQR